MNSFLGPSGLDTSFGGIVTDVENNCWPTLKKIIKRETIGEGDFDENATYLALSRVRNRPHRASFEYSLTITIQTDRHRIGDAGRSLTVTDRGFGNVLNGLEFNQIAIATNGDLTVPIPIDGISLASRPSAPVPRTFHPDQRWTSRLTTP